MLRVFVEAKYSRTRCISDSLKDVKVLALTAIFFSSLRYYKNVITASTASIHSLMLNF